MMKGSVYEAKAKVRAGKMTRLQLTAPAEDATVAMDALIDAATASAQTSLSGPASASLSQTDDLGGFVFPEDVAVADIPDPCFPQTSDGVSSCHHRARRRPS